VQTSSHHVYIEVSPSRLELAVVRGRRVLRTAVQMSTLASGEHEFPESLSGLRVSLSKLVEECQCKGLKATVIYQSAASSVLATSAPSSLGPADVEEAARLAIAGVADFSIEGAPLAMSALLTDHPVAGSAHSMRQSHSLSATERTETIEAIGDWVVHAGLRFAGAVPAGAVAMHAAVMAAWSIGGRSRDHAAVLWIGEHGSGLACVTGGSVRFVRHFGVGIESLVGALCQPLRGRDEQAPELLLDRTTARALLADVGVPAPDHPLPGLPGYTGAAVLPVIQPALQRITIEAKQSLRFGIPEQERTSIKMQIVGPGANIPGLAEWVTRQCNLERVETSAQTRANGPGDLSSTCGAIAGVIAAGHDIPILVPEQLARQRVRGRARMALAVGVALAGGWIGSDWYSARAELDDQTLRLSALQSEMSEGESAARLRQATIVARQAFGGVEGRVAAALGSGADAPGVLEAVALAASPEVRLSTIELQSAKESLTCRISGFVRLSESSDPTRAITSFVDSLAATPLFRSVRLGSTQRTRIDGAQSHAFDLIVEVVPLPLGRHAAGIGNSAPLVVAESEQQP